MLDAASLLKLPKADEKKKDATGKGKETKKKDEE